MIYLYKFMFSLKTKNKRVSEQGWINRSYYTKYAWLRVDSRIFEYIFKRWYILHVYIHCYNIKGCIRKQKWLKLTLKEKLRLSYVSDVFRQRFCALNDINDLITTFSMFSLLLYFYHLRPLSLHKRISNYSI